MTREQMEMDAEVLMYLSTRVKTGPEANAVERALNNLRTRLALLGLERDERQAVTSEQAAKDIKILEQIHAKSWDEAVALRHAAEALSERDERAEKIGQAVLRSISGMDPERREYRLRLIAIEHGPDTWEHDILNAIAAALEAP